MKKLLTLFALASFLTFGVSNCAMAQEGEEAATEETATEMVDSAAMAAEKAAEEAAAVAEKRQWKPKRMLRKQQWLKRKNLFTKY